MGELELGGVWIRFLFKLLLECYGIGVRMELSSYKLFTNLHESE